MKSREIKLWIKKAQKHDKDAFIELMQLYMKHHFTTFENKITHKAHFVVL